MTIFFKLFITAFTFILISACGGSSQQEVLTGSFIDSPVEGLSYSTPSRSGMTNSDGEFEYLQGETVTFSIGGIEIGSAVGVDVITPFTLFSLAPPSTREEVMDAIYDNEITDLDRVFNISTLLVSLDANGDPDDGIDLSDWDTVLTSASLSFDYQTDKFANTVFEEFRRTYMIGENRFQESIPHLFSSLEILVTEYQRTSNIKETTDAEGELSSVEISSYTYDEAGRLLLSLHEEDQDADGIVDSTRTDSYTYDQDGNQLSYISENNTGVTTTSFSITNIYDENDNIVTTSTETIFLGNEFITFESGQMTTFSYNQEGRLTNSFVERDSDLDDIIDSTVSTSFSYDDFGELINALSESDSSLADGVPDSIASVTYTYDDAGNRLTIFTEEDGDADGVVDTSIRTIYATTLNEREDPLELIIEARTGLDNLLSYSSLYSYAYDDAGNLVSQIFERDSDADGVLDYVSTSTRSYDADGNLLSDFFEVDSDGDGVMNYSSNQIYSYDQLGNRLSYTYEFDENADGILDSVDRYQYAYDENNNLVLTELQEDLDADGALDLTSITRQDWHAFTTELDSISQGTNISFVAAGNPVSEIVIDTATLGGFISFSQVPD